MPDMWPVMGPINSGFGQRMDPVLVMGIGEFHKGVDISAAMGTSVHATADGVVEYAANVGDGYGKMVIIDHGNGLKTCYAHLSKFEVIPGQEIRRGEILGFSGNTGRVTSPHLHYEVRRGGVAINPYQYLQHSAVLQKIQPDLPF